MTFHFPFFRRPDPAPAPVRYVVATRQESRKARVNRIHTELQLGIAVARLTDDERKAAIERAKTMHFETGEEQFQRREREIFAGLAGRRG